MLVRVKLTTKQWHVLAVSPGAEASVRRNLKRVFREAGLQKSLGKIIIPRHEKFVLRDGRRCRIKAKSCPGYLIIEMCWLPSYEKIILSVYGAQYMLPAKKEWYGKNLNTRAAYKRKPTEKELDMKDDAGRSWGDDLYNWKPTAFRSEEEAWLLLGIEKLKDPPKVGLKVGTPVTVIEGTFKGMFGKIEHVDNKDPKNIGYKVILPVFNRPTPVLLRGEQIRETREW